MGKTLKLTDEDRQQYAREIEHGLEFARGILNAPSILQQVPSGSRVRAIPIEERDPAKHYDIETPRMLAMVIPIQTSQSLSTPRATSGPRRISRDRETQKKRIRAAHR